MNRPVNLALRPVLACLPAWFRFAQCLRRYRDTREAFPHLANAGKYASTFFVVLFSTLFNVYRGASAMVVLLEKATLCFISLTVRCVIKRAKVCNATSWRGGKKFSLIPTLLWIPNVAFVPVGDQPVTRNSCKIVFVFHSHTWLPQCCT